MSDTKEEGTTETPVEETPAVESNGDAMEVDDKKEEEEPAADDAAKEEAKAEEGDDADADEKEEEKESAEEEGKTEEGGDDDGDEAMDEDFDPDADAEDSEGGGDGGTKTPKKRGMPSTPGSSTTPSSSKRQRKATTFLEPKNFKTDKESSKDLKIPKGRGVAFKDIEAIKENIAKRKPKDPVLAEFHKFLLGGVGGLLGKGRTPAKLIRPHILEFSGYIPEELEGETDEEKQEAEDVLKARFQDKVDKLKLPLIKSFFDVIGLKRGPINGKIPNKDDLATKLLEFLACPKAEECIKSPTKRRGRPPKSASADSAGASPSPTKKRRGRPPKVKKDDEAAPAPAPEEEEEDFEIGKMPSDKHLKRWVKAYVTCFNLDKATANHAVQTASDKFEVDMDDKKGVIMEMLKEAMSK